MARSLRWAAYGVAEFHGWHFGVYRFEIGKVDGPDMRFTASSTLAAMCGAALLAVAALELAASWRLCDLLVSPCLDRCRLQPEAVAYT